MRCIIVLGIVIKYFFLGLRGVLLFLVFFEFFFMIMFMECDFVRLEVDCDGGVNDLYFESDLSLVLVFLDFLVLFFLILDCIIDEVFLF